MKIRIPPFSLGVYMYVGAGGRDVGMKEKDTYHLFLYLPFSFVVLENIFIIKEEIIFKSIISSLEQL